jgi:hypothetical protein
MGQKSNLVTLRAKEKFLHLYRENKVEFLYGFYFSKLLKFLFNSRKVYVTSLVLNFVENKIYINGDLFFRIAKVLFFKKVKLKKPLSSVLSLSFFNSLNFLKKKLIIFKFNLINLKLKKKKVLLFETFKANKKYAFSLFPRRFNFFLDFLKLSILFKENNVQASFFITIFAEIFRILQKKKHTKFLFFFNKYFKDLINKKSLNNTSTLSGLKLIIRGKLKGKRRKSNAIISAGQTPIQSLQKDVDFAKTHAFTVYGTFGLKLWVYRSKH